MQKNHLSLIIILLQILQIKFLEITISPTFANNELFRFLSKA